MHTHIITHPIDADHTLAVGLVETDEARVESDDRAHQVVAVCRVALFVLLETLHFEVQRLLLCDLCRGEVEQLGRILLALDLAGCC